MIKRIGGLPENCHMCRVLDVESVRHLCAVNSIPFPTDVDSVIAMTTPTPGREGIITHGS